MSPFPRRLPLWAGVQSRARRMIRCGCDTVATILRAPPVTTVLSLPPPGRSKTPPVLPPFIRRMRRARRTPPKTHWGHRRWWFSSKLPPIFIVHFPWPTKSLMVRPISPRGRGVVRVHIWWGSARMGGPVSSAGTTRWWRREGVLVWRVETFSVTLLKDKDMMYCTSIV